MKFTIFAALAAFSAFGQNTTAAKPAAAQPEKIEEKAPAIDTSKIWRLVSEAQSLRMQASQTPQAKSADAADEAVKREQARLEAICGQSYALGYESDEHSPRFKDLVCMAKPPAEAKKEK